MRQLLRKIGITLTATMLFLAAVGAAGATEVLAGPHFTFSPASGSYDNGSTFTTTLGVDSGTEEVIAMDVVGTFDATKLELVSVTKATNAVFDFSFDSTTPIIDNATGKYEMALMPISLSVYDGKVLNGPLLVFTFKAKSAGSASVNLTCQSGAIADANIIDMESMDVIDCSANQSALFTLTATGGSTEATPTPTTTSTYSPPSSTSTTTSTSEELPQTGGITSTLGLMIFGLVSVGGAFLLRFL